MDARGRLSNLGAGDGRCERLCDVLQFCSPTSLQSRFATCFNKNNLSGTVELVDHYKLMQSDGKNICFQIESPLGSVYQGVGESSLLIEIERLKLALSHANEKEKLLNKLLEQKDGEIQVLKDLLKMVMPE